MGKTVFSTVGKVARNNAFVLPVFLAALVLLIASLPIMAEDYVTTLRGYLLLPTNKVWTFTAYFVALIPQAGQIVMIAMASAMWENHKGIAILCALAVLGCFFTDVYTDLYWRSSVDNIPVGLTMVDVTWSALFETIFIYTLTSEIFFSVGLGITWELWPDAWSEWKSLVPRAKAKLEEKINPNPNTNRTHVGRRNE